MTQGRIDSSFPRARSFAIAGILIAGMMAGRGLAQGDPKPAEKPPAALQEEETPKSPDPARTVIITASRRESDPVEVTDVFQVIPRRAIEEIRPPGVGKLMEYVPGTNIETGTGSGLPKRSIVSLNGLPANYTLVLVDGQRLLSDHIHTGQNLELIAPESIERIEVIRGAASAQYGSDAIGGVVNIITRKCGKSAETLVGASAGSYHTYEGDVSLLKPVDEKVRASVFLHRDQSDGVPLEAPASRIGNMGYERHIGTARLHADLGTSTEAFGWVHAVDSTSDWREADADSLLVMTGLGLSHRLTPALGVNLQLPYSRWESETNGEKNEWVEPELHFTLRSRDGHVFTLGGEYRHNEFSRTAVKAPDQDALGAFVQYERRLAEGMILAGALRVDDVEDVETALSPKVSFLWAPDLPAVLRASVSRGFHAPTLQEMYEEGYGHGGRALRFGNPYLEPEYSLTGALGIDVHPVDPLQISVYGHYSAIDNMIVPVYEGVWAANPAYDVWRRTNIEDARVFGFEVSARLTFCPNARLEGGFTWTDSEDRESGRQLPYHPGSSAFAKMVAEGSLGGEWTWSGFLGLRAVFDRSAWNWKPPAGAPAGDPSGMITKLEDYQMLDGGVSVTYRKLTFFINVYNILAQDIENLDDAYTVTDGEPSAKAGFRWTF